MLWNLLSNIFLPSPTDILSTDFFFFFEGDVERMSAIYPGLKNKKGSPGWCGSENSMPGCEPKGYRFDSQSGQVPGLWAGAPVGAA